MDKASPFVRFPLKHQLRETYDRLGYLLRLANDWETLINTGMDIEEAEEIIKKLESQYLTLNCYGK